MLKKRWELIKKSITNNFQVIQGTVSIITLYP